MDELDRRFDGSCFVSRPGDAPEEQPDDLVADKLVDEPIVAEDDLRANPVEDIEEASELGWSHTLGDPRRAANIGEQEADRDFRSRNPLLSEVLDAVRAHRRIARKATESDASKHRAPDALEWGQAQLAARRGRDIPDHISEASHAGVLPGEDLPEVVFRHCLRHCPDDTPRRGGPLDWTA